MEVQAGAVCKTVGSAYVGSNPTPATTCENGPLAAETRPGGPFPSCPAVCHVCRRRSWRSDRYGHIADSVRAEGAVRGTACFADPRPFCPVTRPRTARLTGACRASRAAGSPPFCSRWTAAWSFVPAAGAGCRIGPRRPIEAATEAVTESASPAAGWKTGTAPWRATLARVWTLHERRRHAARVPGVPSGTGSG